MKLLLIIPALVFLLLCVGGHFYTKLPVSVPVYSPWQIPQGADLSEELKWQAHEIAEANRYLGKPRRAK